MGHVFCSFAMMAFLILPLFGSFSAMRASTVGGPNAKCKVHLAFRPKLCSAAGRLRVRLDTAENWKLKLKTEKHCSEIIFKCVNSTVGPICNKKVAEKWNLWVHKQYTMCTYWSKKVWKVKVCGYCSLNSTWTVTAIWKNTWKKKKKKANKTQTQTYQPNPNVV